MRLTVRGLRYTIPPQVAEALGRVFGPAAGGVIVVERSLYAWLHRGALATTRPNRILLSIRGTEFIADPELLLHEYFHVLGQWRTGRLTRWRYLAESARRGYWRNRFEEEAREFATAALPALRGYLKLEG